MENVTDKDIVEGLKDTWDAIGADVLEALGGRDATAEEVRENVPTHLSAYADHDRTKAREIAAAFEALPSDKQDELLAEAFPLATYGF